MAADVQQAYDALAADYDRLLQGDQWVRELLWRRYLTYFSPGDHILDVACGTGIDAIFLAERGINVTAVDVSPAMIAQLALKAEHRNLTDRIHTRTLSLNEISILAPARFDGMISAFAGLNTTPDLAAFARAAAALLQPGGTLIVHMLNRFSLWEWLGLVARGRWKAASQLGKEPERVFHIGGQPVKHYLYYPRVVYRRCFEPHFRLRRVYSIGALCPPGTLPSFVAPAVSWLDDGLGSRRPFVNLGRFFVLELARKAR